MSTETPYAPVSEALRRASYLSHFTPSLMPPEVLESMLVQREPLLQRLVDTVLDSVAGSGRHHQLLLGPRGIGKTHLMSLLHHRLSQQAAVQQRARLLWMREEEWGVDSFFDWSLRLLRQIAQHDGDTAMALRLDGLTALPLSQAQVQSEHWLAEAVHEKVLVVLLENLDDLFEQMGESGQQQWRAFMQNHPHMVLVATAPASFVGISSQKAPFYGSFDITSLDELSFDEVVLLLEKIARHRGDGELAEFIQTATGRARIRAVHHLAEGNPRIYVIFAQFLTRSALDELVQAFIHTLDELTPYYQARMQSLSGQQRKILNYLVERRGAVPVKDIAQGCYISEQGCSSQLKVLRERRMVRKHEVGRLSYYELREPLMRLCMDVKKQRGQPIGLLVDMLRIWYSTEELRAALAHPEQWGWTDTRYLKAALEKATQGGVDPKLSVLMHEIQSVLSRGKLWQLLPLAEELHAIDPKALQSGQLPSLPLLAIAFSRPDALSSMGLQQLGVLASWLGASADLMEVRHTPEHEMSALALCLASAFRLWQAAPQTGQIAMPSIIKRSTSLSPGMVGLAWFSMVILLRPDRDTLLQIESWVREDSSRVPACFDTDSTALIEAVATAIKTQDRTTLLALPAETRDLVIKLIWPNE